MIDIIANIIVTAAVALTLVAFDAPTWGWVGFSLMAWLLLIVMEKINEANLT